jgi:serine/threonine protein kinase/tetratricopeptide (TPR) repeat protein
LLRVIHADGETEEVYAAKGMKIGRDPANQIVIIGDAGVHRTHAQVEREPSGPLMLTCVDPGATVESDGQVLGQIELRPGITFRIGQASFECRPGHVHPVAKPLGQSCPFCGAGDVSLHGDGPRPCQACGNSLLPIIPAPNAAPILLPRTFGGADATEFVARGGMGFVLKGVDRQTGNNVAIKILNPNLLQTEQPDVRFSKEIELLSKLPLSCMPKFLGHGEVAGFRYLVMEWIEGRSLKALLNDAKSKGELLAADRVIGWFEQVCRGLVWLHGRGIVHRDIKPSNLLLASDDRVRIVDLGVAKGSHQEEVGLTTTGQTIGTLDYMSPEQRSGSAQVDHRADLYSLGVTFYELLTNRLPGIEPKDASAFNPVVPPAMDKILAQLLAVTPKDRFADALETLLAVSPHEIQYQVALLRRKRSTSEWLPDKSLPAVFPNWNVPKLLAVFGIFSPVTLYLFLLYGLKWERLSLWSGVICGATFLLLNTGRLSEFSGDVWDLYYPRPVPKRARITSWIYFLSLAIGVLIVLLIVYQGWWGVFALGLAALAGLHLRANQLPAVKVLASSDIGKAVPLIVFELKRYLTWNWLLCAVPITSLAVGLICGMWSPLRYFQRGCAACAKGDLDTARVEYSTAIRIAPSLFEAYLRRADVLRCKADLDFVDIAAGQFDKDLVKQAITDYTEAIRLDPKAADAFVGRAACYRATHEHESCIEDCISVIRLNPRLADAWRYIASAHYQKSEYHDALAECRFVLAMDPKMAWAHKIRGDVLDKLGMSDDAVEAYNQAIELNPRFWQAYYNRGLVYGHKKNPEPAAAKRDNEKAKELGPKSR